MELNEYNYGFVYMTTNLINGKKYIGQRKYYNGWEKYLGSGVNIKKDIKQYGRNNFTRVILCECKNKEELNYKEEYFINKYNAVASDMFYNISATATGGYDVIAGKSEAEKRMIADKISERNKIDNPMWREDVKDIFRKRMSGKNNPMYGKDRSDISGSNSKVAVRVVCITTGKEFDTRQQASEYYKCSATSISTNCRFRLKSAGRNPETGEKLVWMYKNDYDEMNHMGLSYPEYLDYKNKGGKSG